MTHIFFTRHGQTVWNVENKICGATDIELTAYGHTQAEQLGRKIRDDGLKIDEILYSPLIRASETARHISEITGIPRTCEPRLIERNFGYFESTPRDADNFKTSKSYFAEHFGTGETTLHLAQRIYNFLDDLKADNSGKTCLLVAHNGIARVVHSYFNDMSNEEFAEFSLKNCEIREYFF